MNLQSLQEFWIPLGRNASLISFDCESVMLLTRSTIDSKSTENPSTFIPK